MRDFRERMGARAREDFHIQEWRQYPPWVNFIRMMFVVGFIAFAFFLFNQIMSMQ